LLLSLGVVYRIGLIIPNFVFEERPGWITLLENAARAQPRLNNNKPRYCDWPKQARCKAREVQVYAHSASILNAADYLFSTIPKGLRIGYFSLQMSLSHFGAKDVQLHCISNWLCASTIQIPADSITQNLG